MIRPILQGSKPICGQCCVAMIAEVAVEVAIQHVGKKGATHKQDLVRGLSKMGFEAGPTKRVHKGRIPIDILAIVRLNMKGKSKGHWILIDHGMIFDSDSESGGPFLVSQYMELTTPFGLKPTSYFEVKKA